jgi:hypothetical protein
MRRSIFVLAFAAVSVSQTWAIFGNPSQVDTVYNSVGLLGNLDGSNNFVSGGVSCVAIDPHWILTARHVDGGAMLVHGNVYTAVAGQDFADPNSDLRLIQVNQTVPTADIAKLGLDASYVGQTTTLVGYGGTGTGITGNAYNVGGADGQRHSAVNVLDGTELIQFDVTQVPWLAYKYTLSDPNGTGDYIPGEGGIWFGDSGGAWFVSTPGGPKLIATSSAIDNPNFPNGGHENEFGGEGFGTSLTPNVAFIALHVPGAVPEPASMLILGGGIAALLRRRKRPS